VYVEYEEFEEYEEYVVYKEYEEFNTDRNIAKKHITSKVEEDYKLQEVQGPSLRGGCNQEEFQAAYNNGAYTEDSTVGGIN
jgi:hypothetical protein